MEDFIKELMQSADKFKAGATSLEVIRYPEKYISAKYHSTLSDMELEDLISHVAGSRNFRFDIKWRARDVQKPGYVQIFVDTKNYSRAKGMFKDLGQFKAYLEKIDSFDQLYIIQQGGRGVTREKIIDELKKEFQKGTNMRDVFQVIWDNETLRKSTFSELDFQEALDLFSHEIKSGKHLLYQIIQTTVN